MSDDPNISRREFMSRTALLSSLAFSYPLAALAELRQSKNNDDLPDWMQKRQWQTLAQVQKILFPAGEDNPGADDIDAIVYLHNAIENPKADGADKDFVFRGISWLDDLTQERFDKTFLKLTVKQQETIIEVIVKSRAGRNWVSKLLTYTLEALLTDPVYGGNKDGSGWKWLEHTPGYPTPPEDKTWDRLLQRRYKS